MTCLAPHAISEAATTGELDGHFDECLTCRRQLDSERALRLRLQALPVPALTQARRRELAAELVAIAARRPVRSPRRIAWVASALAAAAAVAWLWPRRLAPVEIELARVEERVVSSVRIVASDDAPPPLSPPHISAQDGSRVSHELVGERDVITLADGSVDVDTTHSRAVDVRIGATVVRVDGAKVTVVAKQHAIVRVHVVVGAASIISPDRRIVVERGSVWTAEETASERSLHAFRDAWIALRAGNNREAIALFDTATDPTVAEEAAYWAAIATKRMGDDAAARVRMTDFLARFPQSPYATQARALLER